MYHLHQVMVYRASGTFLEPQPQSGEGYGRPPKDAKPTVDVAGPIQDLRLVNGVSNSSGRIELLINGQWGTVCEDRWNVTDTNVVCRQLGYLAAVVTYSYAFFGEGSGVIWSTNSQCNGSESSLSECKVQIIEALDCNHSQDVGVLCGSKKSYCERKSYDK
ncbi:Macrophage scavenger receptor types I and II [Holothuria leucospilota]|uniref:Macrophage scavenger receptor types I and II n=1 Tax=Holothuria leucospilota TaxID=206669 RepID=A0A9Q1CDH3_HOLLE|nr:Macrophage scavenger receptor types I and II [Holothuria leucospilota]